MANSVDRRQSPRLCRLWRDKTTNTLKQKLSTMNAVAGRCQDELKGFCGGAKEDEDIMAGRKEATGRQRLSASVRSGERMALQVWATTESRCARRSLCVSCFQLQLLFFRKEGGDERRCDAVKAIAAYGAYRKPKTVRWVRPAIPCRFSVIIARVRGRKAYRCHLQGQLWGCECAYE